ncbi:hypothetical protein SLEP1_g1056 [Rubroshorea leprosula]|uniref:Uncharacterized protein n=1 Tax=Rubroshorea leprosula TaxID=152421 RepID=A0AAV5HN10_9ROSI|nr:hypothetical protein SLEP1_g1056 [Rubroshorea leprosula]
MSLYVVWTQPVISTTGARTSPGVDRRSDFDVKGDGTGGTCGSFHFFVQHAVSGSHGGGRVRTRAWIWVRGCEFWAWKRGVAFYWGWETVLLVLDLMVRLQLGWVTRGNLRAEKLGLFIVGVVGLGYHGNMNIIVGKQLISLVALTTRVENRSQWALLVLDFMRGGIDGETIMKIEILPRAQIDLIPSTIFRNDNEDNPVFVYAHTDGMDTQFWTPLDPNMIKYNAKVFLGFVGFRKPIETAFFGGSKFGRLRVVVEVKNAVKKMMDKIMGRN